MQVALRASVVCWVVVVNIGVFGFLKMFVVAVFLLVRERSFAALRMTGGHAGECDTGVDGPLRSG